jgi:putative OPT family oligopeptide transporter
VLWEERHPDPARLVNPYRAMLTCASLPLPSWLHISSLKEDALAKVAEPKTAEPAFKPYIPDRERPYEFTFRALLFGALFGILFGAVTVYVGLRAGLTVAASIPIAVLSISILRALSRVLPPFGRPTILENNIVQTTGSAGESVAGGVIFTLPALIFLGFGMDYWRVFLLALFGGWLGVLFMIPLRRQLIVKEHGNLLYPEGTACADVLIAGDRGGSFASRVFWGLGLGGLYTLFQNENVFAAWPSSPRYTPSWLPGGAVVGNTTSEYLGVGYIIGPRIAGVLFAGGVFAWLVVMPAIKFFGGHVLGAVYPGTIPISQMDSDTLWVTYIRPIGAGAVACSGLITLLRTMPTIIAALRAGAKDFGKSSKVAASTRRTENDLSLKVTLVGSLIVLAMMWAMLTFMPVTGAPTKWYSNLVAAIFVVIFGFLFVTVSSRITGLIGTSSNPISGMAIATLMATSAVFLLLGWTASAYGALALSIGGVVCISSANAGNTSQDLKTGFIVGATPKYQQMGLMLGVLTSVAVIGATLMTMNKSLEEFRPANIAVDMNHLPDGVKQDTTVFSEKSVKVNVGTSGEDRMVEQSVEGFILLNALGSPEVPDGKYFYNPQTRRIEVQWIQGIGSSRAPAPQAKLMSTVISGILQRRLPWGLILLGVFMIIAVELLGVRSLSFAVGFYISIGTTLIMFCGGVVRWLVEFMAKRATRDTYKKEPIVNILETEVSPGALYASGLIAAGGIVGLVGVAIRYMEKQNWLREDAFHMNWHMGPQTAKIVAVLAFLALASSAYYFARKPLESERKK